MGCGKIRHKKEGAKWIIDDRDIYLYSHGYCPLCKVYTVDEYVWLSKPEELKGYEGAKVETCKMCNDIIKMAKLQIEARQFNG